jgi:hypothetical protein
VPAPYQHPQPFAQILKQGGRADNKSQQGDMCATIALPRLIVQTEADGQIGHDRA